MGAIKQVLPEMPTAAKASITCSAYPVGATVFPGGVNFSIFSRGDTDIDLLLFDRIDDARPARVIRIDPAENRTYHYWHTFVAGLGAGQIYGFRVHGPYDPAAGYRFDSTKVLLDPYGRAVVVPRDYSRIAAAAKGDDTPTTMKSVVVDSSAYDWEGDRPLKRPTSRTVIYENR
jgi:isoamylase